MSTNDLLLAHPRETDSRVQAEMRTMTLHGDRVAYRDEGAGEVLLLVHGMGGSSSSWRELVPKLAKKYRVIAPDLLGHGLSDKPRGDYSVGAFAVWLRDLLDTLGVPKATIVGHSLGGGIAMQFAHQHRDYCQRLILISSGGLGADVGALLRLLSLPGSELLLNALASRPVLHATDVLRVKLSLDGEVTRFSETLRAQAWLTDRDSRRAFLRTLRSVVDHRGQAVCALNRLHCNADLPALIITGDQDRVIPGRACARRARRAARQPPPRSSRCVAPPAGGMPRHGDGADRRLHRGVHGVLGSFGSPGAGSGRVRPDESTGRPHRPVEVGAAQSHRQPVALHRA